MHSLNNIMLTKLFPNSEVSRVMRAQIMDTILLLICKIPFSSTSSVYKSAVKLEGEQLPYQ